MNLKESALGQLEVEKVGLFDSVHIKSRSWKPGGSAMVQIDILLCFSHETTTAEHNNPSQSGTCEENRAEEHTHFNEGGLSHMLFSHEGSIYDFTQFAQGHQCWPGLANDGFHGSSVAWSTSSQELEFSLPTQTPMLLVQLADLGACASKSVGTSVVQRTENLALKCVMNHTTQIQKASANKHSLRRRRATQSQCEHQLALWSLL